MSQVYQRMMQRLRPDIEIKPTTWPPRHARCRHGDAGCDGVCEPPRCIRIQAWDYEPPLRFCEECWETFQASEAASGSGPREEA